MVEAQSIKIAVVGDVHDQWEAADTDALVQLAVDLVLFVGDFGNEAIEVVRRVAAVPLPKAVILGNHDVWYTASARNRKRCPYDRTREDRLQQQLEVLGEAHVGFGKLDFPELGLTVIGGRPYSWGGPKWRPKRFYRERFGVTGFQGATERITQAIASATFDQLIFLGHNGPTGLGTEPHSPCGKDWKPIGGDFGDRDLADAIATAKSLHKQVSLVTFGHMHHALKHDKSRLRQRWARDNDGTLYLNAAQVPRIVSHGSSYRRSFALVQLQSGQVEDLSMVWVTDQSYQVTYEVLYNRSLTPCPAFP